MATNIQNLRSSVAYKRPSPAPLLDGQICMNFNALEPGLYFRLTNGDLCKTGPAAITDNGERPNAAPGGHVGNSPGEHWLNAHPMLHSPIGYVYNGTEFVTANGFTVDEKTGDMTCMKNLTLGSVTISGSGTNGAGNWSIQPDFERIVVVDNITGKRYELNMTQVT